MSRTTTILVSLAVAASGCAPAAYDAPYTAIEFAMALGRDHSGGIHPDSLRTMSGRVPEEIRDLVYLPPDARLLGSIRGPTFISVYAATQLGSDSVGRLYRSELLGRDWLPRGIHGGPVDPAAERIPGSYCRSGWQLSIGIRDLARGPNDLMLSYLRSDCDPEPYLAQANLVPPLYPPAGTQVMGGPCTAVGSVAGGANSVSNAPPPDSLLAHYGRQLEAAGWRPAPAPTCAHAASWEREDDQGERVVHSIVAAVDPYRPECQIVTFVTNTR